MSKYDSLKIWKETKARNTRVCDKCSQNIGKGKIYYKKSVGKVNAPGLALRGFCTKYHREKEGKVAQTGATGRGVSYRLK